MPRTTDLAVLMPSLPVGGVGKMRTHLVNEIAARGYRVDLVLANLESPYRAMLHSDIRLVKLPTTHAVGGIPALASYLWRNKPKVLLSQRIRVNVLARRAHCVAGGKTRLFTTINANMSYKLSGYADPKKRAKELRRLRQDVARFDGIIAVSRGVAEDAAALMNIPASRIQVAPNPTVTPDLARLAAEPLDHTWFQTGEPPVILGVGRLTRPKGFAMLLRAFARVRQNRPCRLVVLGEGSYREGLTQLATELGVAEDVDLPGFVINPYQYMQRAAVFALSSESEGSPNALTEALAIGTPLVSTDCPSGPMEVLEGGKHGPLVPVGDDEAMAAAIEQVMDAPPDPAQLQQAAQRYTVTRSADAYLAALGLSQEPKP